MRFELTDTARVRRLARLLQRDLAALGAPAGYLTCLETVSRLYGYASFVDLKANIAGEGSAFDDRVGPDVAAARRAHHIQVLQRTGIDAGQAALIIDRIRPTGYGHGASAADGPVSKVSPHDPVVASSGPPADIVGALVRQALDVRAGSLEFVPTSDSYAVIQNRFGVHTRVHSGPRAEHDALLEVQEARVGLDGHKLGVERWGVLRFVHEGKPRDVQAHVDRGHEGKRLYLRIPDPDWFRPGLDDIGLTRVSEWRRAINRKAGLCLVCGAAGSGKSTTIAASLRELERQGRKVAPKGNRLGSRTPLFRRVMEGPVARFGSLGAAARRSATGPGVVDIGEIREEGTVSAAVEAVEAGHLVFGTMVYRSIPRVIEILRKLGPIEDILAGVIVQELVKVTCATCRGTGDADGERCMVCHGTGYSGRTMVSECVAFDGPGDVSRVLALSGHDVRSEPKPWPQMVDDGIGKMLSGVLSSEEAQTGFGQAFVDRCGAMNVDPGDYTAARMAQRIG